PMLVNVDGHHHATLCDVGFERLELGWTHVRHELVFRRVPNGHVRAFPSSITCCPVLGSIRLTGPAPPSFPIALIFPRSIRRSCLRAHRPSLRPPFTTRSSRRSACVSRRGSRCLSNRCCRSCMSAISTSTLSMPLSSLSACMLSLCLSASLSVCLV